MAILDRALDENGEPHGWFIHCPGCDQPHLFVTAEREGEPRWSFDGNMDAPTFEPSMLVNPNHAESRCHSLVRKGKIQFLYDSWHRLRGRTVPLPDTDI